MIAIPILLVIFGFVGFIVKWAMDHEQEKLRIKAGLSNRESLTESELRRMIQEAVDEAVAPLRSRLDRLAPEPDSPIGEEPSLRVIDEIDESEAPEEVASRSRRRTR
jgi:hypothetical protein